ncbi:hypothetical protein HN358_01530 [Candidatus Uhrbacteria bacterium]|jgi:hypothetical protein|nr:hypothetical protein [Candidatus Uhrbacteria bacterium]MBT7717289.1 hypothetical protein [Candidatus Uhrbacteria bacterium]
MLGVEFYKDPNADEVRKRASALRAEKGVGAQPRDLRGERSEEQVAKEAQEDVEDRVADLDLKTAEVIKSFDLDGTEFADDKPAEEKAA